MTEKSFVEQKSVVLRNLTNIRENILRACEQAGRNPFDITLMAVTKTVPADLVNVVLDAGVTVIGENRVQEFCQKAPYLHLDNVDVHLIGHLQTNKVRQIVGRVSTIQSVDSLRLAEAISKESQKQGICTNILVEINVGNECSKSGISVNETESFLRKIAQLPAVCVKGLMAIPPNTRIFDEKMKNFSIMQQLLVDISDKNIDNIHMDILSMGMSNDYYEAILNGATMIRVGSSLFGARAPLYAST